MASQKRRLIALVPAGILGGILGGVLLLRTGEGLFRALVPFLVLFASLLLAAQSPVKKMIDGLGRARSQGKDEARSSIQEPAQAPKGPGIAALLCIGATAVYGGYFGAGVSVIIVAALGLAVDDDLVRLNALKQALSFSINAAAVVFFLFSGRIDWAVAAIMAAGALLGGVLGGKIANRIAPAPLKLSVVSLGIAISLYYFIWAGK